jgi:hypothetical protein
LQPTAVKIALLHLPSNHHAARQLPRTNTATPATSQGARPAWTYASWWTYIGRDTTSSLPDLQRQQMGAAPHDDALGDGVVGDTGWAAPTLSPEEVAAKAAAKAAAMERYLKAYADPAGKHVATQLPADTGALRPSRAGVEEGTPLRPIERARNHNRATRQRQQQQTGVAAAKAATLAAPTLSPEEVAAKAAAKAATMERLGLGPGPGPGLGLRVRA